MYEVFNNFVNFANSIIWATPFIVVMLGGGLFFSMHTKFVQLRLLPTMTRLLISREASDKGTSSFQAFCTALAGRIGPGNITGTALAIYYGGPGSIFWMWMLAILGAATTYVETALAQLYKRNIDGEWRGGTAYFVQSRFGNRWFSAICALAVLIACSVCFPGPASNQTSAAFKTIFPNSGWLSAIVVTGLLGLIIFGGIKRIARTAEIIVPFMSVIYIGLTVALIFSNLDRVGNAFGMIFMGAFGLDAAFGGILGTTIAWGVQRGVYSNEAGMGLQTYTGATAEVSHPAKAGLVQAAGIYIDTLFVCTATAIMMLVTDCFNVVGADGTFLYIGQGSADIAVFAKTGETGVPVVQSAAATLLPTVGPIIIAVCMAFFAFTCLIAYYYLSESSLTFLFRGNTTKTRKTATMVLRVVILLVTFIMSNNSVEAVFNAGDLGCGICAWTNMAALFLMYKPAMKLLKDYEAQRKLAKGTPRERDEAPFFDPKKVDFVDQEIRDVWSDINREKIDAANAG